VFLFKRVTVVEGAHLRTAGGMSHYFILYLLGIMCLVLSLALLLMPTQQAERRRLERLLQRTAAALEAGAVTYWVIDGTLLGAVREARVILGDYDADLNIPLESLPAMRRVDWAAAGLVCYAGYGGFRVKASALDTLRVDIFVRRDVGGVMRYGWPRLDRAYEKTITPARLIYPLRRYRMGDYEVYGPAEAHRLLRQQYGAAYFTRAPKTWSDAAWVGFETHVWARIIPLASYFSPPMPY
jgi:hypothetical protein